MRMVPIRRVKMLPEDRTSRSDRMMKSAAHYHDVGVEEEVKDVEVRPQGCCCKNDR